MHHNHHEIRAMAREQEQDRLRDARRRAAREKHASAHPGLGLAPGGLLRRAFCRILGSTLRRVGFGLMRSGRRLARIA